MAVVELGRPDKDVVVITMNRPEALNALNQDMMDGLWGALEEVRRDTSCRVVILTGAGGAFCSGADRKEGMQAVPGDEERSYLGRIWGLQEYVSGFAVALTELRQPVIAAIDGVAVGGGFGYALASDLRVASDRARLGAVFMRAGLSNLDVGTSYFLPRLIGASKALEMMLTARIVDAEQADRLGLLSDLVPPERLLDRALELATEIAANSEFGVWQTKDAFWAGVDAPSLRAALKVEYRAQMVGMYLDDHDEAVASFREKRPPNWGRV
ncbi:enoyl-CoA hydratase-related protein [Pseudonocardia sp. NPDC049154]|uniref:enoyl-CoA hydratase/isomerase family protein n=1 Tax=Pseudonocardia sp. NPDC049154 TaxID=3155501 RepID=UPI00340930C3